MKLTSLEPYPIDYADVLERSEEMGKTNLRYNIYEVAIRMYRTYADEGLTPVILFDPMTGGLAVTSEEYLNDKLH